MDNVETRYQDRFMVSEISEWGRNKIDRDLQFIKLVTSVGKELGLRVIIAGGYAVDGNLGQITRPHNDIDIQVYGTSPNGVALINSILKNIGAENPSFSDIEIKKDHVRETFYHNIFAEMPGLGADFYYVQVEANPFGDTKIIIKDNGEKTEPRPYETVQVELQGVTFEAQHPKVELEDKVEKSEKTRGRRPEIEQDIYNLHLLLQHQK